MEQPMLPQDCKTVMLVLQTELKALENRVTRNELGIRMLDEAIDGHIDKLYNNLREGQDKLKQIIQEHANDDAEAMTEIREQLLARVPAWALALLTVGGTMIGAMATYILDHLK